MAKVRPTSGAAATEGSVAKLEDSAAERRWIQMAGSGEGWDMATIESGDRADG